MEKKRNWIVVALCVAIVGMGIGFAALAQNLQINATANITGEWDIKIENVYLFESYGATTTGTPTWDGTSTTFEVDLAHPGAWAEFVISIKNDGNIDAVLNSITGITAANSTNPSEIQFTYQVMGPVQPLSRNDVDLVGGTTMIMPAGAGNGVFVRVEWIVEPGVESTIPDTTTKTATINLNYVQNT